MTTSDYLKTQADLLIALATLQRAKLDEFTAKTEEIEARGGELCDHAGLAVVTDPARMRKLAQSAGQFVRAGEVKCA